MNICIVENEQHHIDFFTALLHRWEKENNCTTRLTIYTSEKPLMNEDIPNFDIIFLDIQLEHITGIEVAQSLRENGYKNEIVFLTAYHEYVFEGYNVHALNYLIKPIQYKQLEHCLNYVKNQLDEANFLYRCKETLLSIPYKKIIYFSSNNHCIDIVTNEGTYTQNGSLRNLISQLPYSFVYCHRTLIININHIEMIRGKNVLMSNNEILPISNTYYKQLQEAFMKHHF